MLIKSQLDVYLHTGCSVHFHPSPFTRHSFLVFQGSGGGAWVVQLSLCKHHSGCEISCQGVPNQPASLPILGWGVLGVAFQLPSWRHCWRTPIHRFYVLWRTQDLDHVRVSLHIGVLFYGSLVFACCLMLWVLYHCGRGAGRCNCSLIGQWLVSNNNLL